MTYLQFLLLFLVLPIGLLAPVALRYDPRPTELSFGRALLAIVLIAFAYTTPWDNYLVASGVWTYGLDRVVGTIAWVPIEEYAFFALQPVLAGLWTRIVLGRSNAVRPVSRSVVGATAAVFALLFVIGVVLLIMGGHARYMGLILVWCGPVLAALTVFAGDNILARARPAALAIAVPTLFLWAADTLAIRLGIWTIQPSASFGIEPLGLPIEEGTFFLVTNVLVVFGLLTFLYGRRA